MQTISCAPANESLVTTLRSFPRPVWILFAGVFLNKFGTFVVPFLCAPARKLADGALLLVRRTGES